MPFVHMRKNWVGVVVLVVSALVKTIIVIYELNKYIKKLMTHHTLTQLNPTQLNSNIKTHNKPQPNNQTHLNLY